MSIAYAIAQVNTIEAESALETFINTDLKDALGHINNISASVYLYCCLDNVQHAGRRILVVSASNEEVVRVCIEAAYELFEGDTHYYVARIGTADRDKAGAEVPALLRKAYESLVNWKPTHENIWDNVY